jgi:hypothetical protein
MPSTQSHRDVILKTSVAAGTVADLSVSYDALFESASAGAITYEDESGVRDDKTKYKLTFAGIGAVTFKFVADTTLPTGSSATVQKTRAGYVFEPTGREGSVALLSAPAASYERIWKQNARDSARNEVVDHVVKLDVRVEAEGSHTVEQTVKSTDAGELVLVYEWSSATAGVVLSGTVTLTPSVAPGAGYTVGNARVTDNNPTSGSARRR